MPFATSGNARVWHETSGSGPSVVLVHGGLLEAMDAARFWITPGIAKALKDAGYRVTVYDRRFSGGRTVAPIAEHSWDIEADDLMAVLAATRDGPAHIVAGSNGVSSALRLASGHPEHVLSLALCWPAAPDNRDLHHAFDEARATMRELGPSGYVEAARRPAGDRPLLFEHVLRHDATEAERVRRMAPDEAVSILDACEDKLLAGDVVRGVSRGDLDAIGDSSIPTIVLPATPADRVHTRAIAEHLGDRLATARLVAGTTVSPSPRFPRHLHAFTTRLVQHLASSQGKA